MFVPMRTRLDLLLICAFAVYRGWHLIARDKVVERPREALYDRWPPSAKRALVRTEWNADMREVVFHARPTAGRAKPPRVSLVSQSVDCPWCLPTFAAVAMTIAVDASFGLTWPVAWFGALCCVIGLLGAVEGK